MTDFAWTLITAVATFLLILFILYGRGAASALAGSGSRGPRMPHFSLRALQHGMLRLLLIALVGCLIVVVIEEIFFDRDEQVRTETLPRGFDLERDLVTLRDGQTSPIYPIPNGDRVSWWQPCATMLNGGQVPRTLMTFVNLRTENGRQVADGFEIRNNTGSTLQYRVYRLRHTQDEQPACR